MTAARDDLCILVVSEIVGDAELVQRLLSFEFSNVRISTDPLRIAADFDAASPSVLVLAFNSLDKAERYNGWLRAASQLARCGAHRTLVLCTREEVRNAYDFCKLGIFDDYVLFWPLTHDTPRLLLAVRHAIQHLPDPTTREQGPGDESAGEDVPEPRESPDPPRPLVLVIDDDAFQHRLLARMLAAEELELLFAASAQQGLELMHQRRPKVVLMDIDMPAVDGVEATRRIKALRQFQGIPVVMVTGLGTRDRVVESRQAGASEFLVKPVDREALLQKLRRLGVLPG